MSRFLKARPPVRAAFTIVEIIVAVGIMAVALTLVAQLSVESLGERSRATARQAAQEQAVNVLEAAHACPWDKLTSDWAKAQSLPEPYVRLGWHQEVRVEPEQGRPEVKRVTVKVHWASSMISDPQPVRLVELLAARSAQAPGGKP